MNNQKILIVCSSSRKFSPYVEFYVAECQNYGIEFILITKETEEFATKSDYHKPYILTKELLKTSVVKRTLSWYKYINHIIKTENCNKFIIVPTRTAIILSPMLLFTRKPFIFDIRDYTHENKKWYCFLEKVIMKKAYTTVISSKGFLKWLPYQKNYNIIHNMPVNYQLKSNQRLQSSDYTKINIAYVGMVDYFDQNSVLIDALSHSSRYSLQYSGAIAERCKIREYVDKKGYSNIVFTGSFINSEKFKLYQDADMINAVYGNDSLIVTTALPNKLYDSLIYKIPIIASKGTFLGEIVNEYNIGVVVDVVHDDLQKAFDDYWDNFSYSKFEDNCNLLLEIVSGEMKETKKIIAGFCNA